MTAAQLLELARFLWWLGLAALVVSVLATVSIRRHGGTPVQVAVESYGYPVALFSGVVALVLWVAS